MSIVKDQSKVLDGWFDHMDATVSSWIADSRHIDLVAWETQHPDFMLRVQTRSNNVYYKLGDCPQHFLSTIEVWLGDVDASAQQFLHQLVECVAYPSSSSDHARLIRRLRDHKLPGVGGMWVMGRNPEGGSHICEGALEEQFAWVDPIQLGALLSGLNPQNLVQDFSVSDLKPVQLFSSFKQACEPSEYAVVQWITMPDGIRSTFWGMSEQKNWTKATKVFSLHSSSEQYLTVMDPEQDLDRIRGFVAACAGLDPFRHNVYGINEPQCARWIEGYYMDVSSTSSIHQKMKLRSRR